MHRKNNVTGCKRFLRIEAPGMEARAQTLRRLLWWCVLGEDFDRQRKHIAVPLPIEGCPSIPVLSARSGL